MIISGHVQGVFFRESMLREALQLNVAGWVRNRHDGTVEAMLDGNDEMVKKLIAWAQCGPGMARVTKVDVYEGKGSYSNFEKRETV